MRRSPCWRHCAHDLRRTDGGAHRARCVVEDGASEYAKPLRRDVLRRLVQLLDAQERELQTLRQIVAHHAAPLMD